MTASYEEYEFRRLTRSFDSEVEAEEWGAQIVEDLQFDGFTVKAFTLSYMAPLKAYYAEIEGFKVQQDGEEQWELPLSTH